MFKALSLSLLMAVSTNAFANDVNTTEALTSGSGLYRGTFRVGYTQAKGPAADRYYEDFGDGAPDHIWPNPAGLPMGLALTNNANVTPFAQVMGDTPMLTYVFTREGVSQETDTLDCNRGANYPDGTAADPRFNAVSRGRNSLPRQVVFKKDLEASFVKFITATKKSAIEASVKSKVPAATPQAHIDNAVTEQIELAAKAETEKAFAAALGPWEKKIYADITAPTSGKRFEGEEEAVGLIFGQFCDNGEIRMETKEDGSIGPAVLVVPLLRANVDASGNLNMRAIIETAPYSSTDLQGFSMYEMSPL